MTREREREKGGVSKIRESGVADRHCARSRKLKAGEVYCGGKSVSVKVRKSSDGEPVREAEKESEKMEREREQERKSEKEGTGEKY